MFIAGEQLNTAYAKEYVRLSFNTDFFNKKEKTMNKGLIALCAVMLIIVVACNVNKEETVDTPVVAPVEEVMPEVVPEALPVVPEDNTNQ